ncbi:pyridoxamine 5'-phosphate oxidase-related FMN-binding protein [Mycobacteroides abscessus subsp. abscessus]|uniref:pyridoxamine 5'-phosphate oxidase family protein n=1 Tax=Mycobacteroides abscessus TaxID=36809 RepID=UPI0009287E51|nr:pyridoxamine 5'-phosphate oxidase family protein [Mycobacteroides abscessus]SHS26812.1 pyridoxamine 5'-phosphate oxidase-related FMN-binding protein [Mycobacteroides abscessus subsp. abscessus]
MTYHPGELAVQHRMGQSDNAIRVGQIISTDIPEVAAAFLAAQLLVFISARDDDGRMWASQIVGPPGFAHAADARTIVIDATPDYGDPLAGVLQSERKIGMLALQPQRRRRMRVNGTSVPSGDGLIVTTDQVYSNCPKYIVRRDISEIGPGLPGETRRGSALDDAQQQAVSVTDTFIIGTADGDGNADASHRGGNPGFLRLLSPKLLRWPDYLGNSMFMTLGNLHVDPRCGLLIPDWRTGSTLQLTGTARLNWDESTFAPGAQCSVDFTIDEVVETVNGSPLRWGHAEPSPANPPL